MGSLIGISAKMGHGKDTVGQIILDLTCRHLCREDEFGRQIRAMRPDGLEGDYLTDREDKFRVRKFADKLKEIVAILIGVSRADLEKDEVKNMILPPHWDRWELRRRKEAGGTDKILRLFSSEEDGRAEMEELLFPEHFTLTHVKMTPRLLLQLIGTECGREIIHPNIWVNATFADWSKECNWVITDTRFPNEAVAIKNRRGLLFRVERPGIEVRSTHESETALDGYNSFDELIINDGTLNQLRNKVEKLLLKYDII